MTHVCRGYGRTGVESVVLNLGDGLCRLGGLPIPGLHAEGTPLLGPVVPLDRVKHLSMFLEVARRMFRDQPQAWFAIAVNGSERCALQSMALGFKIASKVKFLAWRQYPERIMAALDIFPVASNKEDGPLTDLGVMAFGSPLVATGVGIMPERGKLERSGLLVPCGDVDAMVAVLGRLLNGGNTTWEAGARLRETVRRGFTKGLKVRRTLERYSRVLDGSMARGGLLLTGNGGS